MGQIVAVAVCIGLNMLDGFDILVMSFTAAGVSADWKLDGARLGVLFSAGLFGMAAGSLLVAPYADRFGRRTIVMAAVLLVSIGMLLSGIARSFGQLAVLRAASGVGIGAILACATVLVAEYSSDAWRSTASYLYTSGYSIGGTVGGAIAAVLIARSGWRSAFEFGAVASFAMLPLVYWKLPESPAFLGVRQPPQSAPTAVRRLFAGSLARQTTLLWICFFFMMGGYYFVFSWTPKLLTASGLSAQQGITSGVLLNLGGIIGTVLFAFIAKVVAVRRLIAVCLLVAGVLMSVFALSIPHFALALVAGVGLGAMTTGAMAGFYALTPALYGPQLRATGMGWGIGMGRFGAILAPLATGLLVDHGWQTLHLYWLFAGTFLLAACALTGMTSRSHDRA